MYVKSVFYFAVTSIRQEVSTAPKRPSLTAARYNRGVWVEGWLALPIYLNEREILGASGWPCDNRIIEPVIGFILPIHLIPTKLPPYSWLTFQDSMIWGNFFSGKKIPNVFSFFSGNFFHFVFKCCETSRNAIKFDVNISTKVGLRKIFACGAIVFRLNILPTMKSLTGLGGMGSLDTYVGWGSTWYTISPPSP